MKSLKQFAVLYRERLNWSIIPLHPETKKPIFKWKPYQTELPTIKQITEWWEQFPDANLGVITGKISGVVVFDCDSKKALDYVEERGLVETACVQSSKPYKRHFYFKYPNFKKGELQNLDGRFYYGIEMDVKGNGGLAVLPPSIHEKYGTQYKWLKSPFETEIADMDIWQLEFCMEAKKRRSKRMARKYYPKYAPNPDWVDYALNGVSEGERDNVAFRLAKFYARRGFTTYQAEDALIKWNYKNNPPLKHTEIKKCVRSALNYVR